MSSSSVFLALAVLSFLDRELISAVCLIAVPKPKAVAGKPKSTVLGKFLDMGTTARQKIGNKTRNETSQKSRFGIRPSDEKLNKLQVDLLGTIKSPSDLTNRYCYEL